MGIMVMAGYRPRPGRETALLEEVRAHVPALRAEGLATDRPALAMQAADGTIIEIFEWVSREAIDSAHANPVVQRMWERFGACCDYVPVGDLDEARQLFSAFVPLETEPRPASRNRSG